MVTRREFCSEQLKYWKEKLNHGDIPSLQLPTDPFKTSPYKHLMVEQVEVLQLSRSVCNQVQAVCHGGDLPSS